MTWNTLFKCLFVAIIIPFIVCSCPLKKHFLDPSSMQDLSDLTDQINQYMDDMRTEWSTPGVAVAFIEGGETVWTAGYGVLDSRAAQRVDPDTTLFQVASISKPVATWGLMRLTETPDDAGDFVRADAPVDINVPVNDYLTRWQLASLYDWNPDWVPQVTLRLILGHRAGLNVSGYLGWPPDECCPTLEESLNGDDNNPLSGPVRIYWAPDALRVYSGGGFSIMQLVMEEVTQQDFAEYMDTTVLEPLGMTSSSYTWSASMVPNLAKPYDSSGNELPNYLFAEKAAAGLYTTVHDLALFAAAILPGPDGELPGRNVLQEETVEAITACNPDPGTTQCGLYNGWGLGYEVRKEKGYFLVGHTGGNQGWKAIFRTIPGMNVGMVVLTNADSGQNLYEEIEWAWKKLYLD